MFNEVIGKKQLAVSGVNNNANIHADNSEDIHVTNGVNISVTKGADISDNRLTAIFALLTAPISAP